MLGRPNAAPLQTQHAARQTARMRRRGPEKSAGTKNPRDFLQQRSRIDQVFQQFRGRDHVEVLRRKRRFLKFAFINFKTQAAHVLDGAWGNIQPLALPAVLACGGEQVSRAATDVQQAIVLAKPRKVRGDLFQSRVDELGRRKLLFAQIEAGIELRARIPRRVRRVDRIAFGTRHDVEFVF